jgi:hypothetical protein
MCGGSEAMPDFSVDRDVDDATWHGRSRFLLLVMSCQAIRRGSAPRRGTRRSRSARRPAHAARPRKITSSPSSHPAAFLAGRQAGRDRSGCNLGEAGPRDLRHRRPRRCRCRAGRRRSRLQPLEAWCATSCGRGPVHRRRIRVSVMRAGLDARRAHRRAVRISAVHGARTARRGCDWPGCPDARQAGRRPAAQGRHGFEGDQRLGGHHPGRDGGRPRICRGTDRAAPSPSRCTSRARTSRSAGRSRRCGRRGSRIGTGVAERVLAGDPDRQFQLVIQPPRSGRSASLPSGWRRWPLRARHGPAPDTRNGGGAGVIGDGQLVEGRRQRRWRGRSRRPERSGMVVAHHEVGEVPRPWPAAACVAAAIGTSMRLRLRFAPAPPCRQQRRDLRGAGAADAARPCAISGPSVGSGHRARWSRRPAALAA